MAKTKKSTKKTLYPAPEIDKFLGKSYVLNRSENYKEFLKEFGVKKYVREKAIKSKPTIVLTQKKHHYVLTTNYPEGWSINVKFKPGKEMHRCGGFMRQTNSVFHIVGDTLIEEQNTDFKKLLIERQFTKKELVVTIKLNDITCFRWFKLSQTESNPSINTETSRRSILWDSGKVKVSSKESVPGTGESKISDDSSDTEGSVCY